MMKREMEEGAYTMHSTIEVASILLHNLLEQRNNHTGKYTFLSWGKVSAQLPKMQTVTDSKSKTNTKEKKYS